MQALQQAGHGRLAGAAAPDDAQRRPDRNLEGDAIEREIASRPCIRNRKLVNSTWPCERRPHAVLADALLLGLIDEVADDGDGDCAPRRTG